MGGWGGVMKQSKNKWTKFAKMASRWDPIIKGGGGVQNGQK